MNLTSRTKLEHHSRTWEWTDGVWRTKEECAELLGISPQGFYQRWTRHRDNPEALSVRGKCKPGRKPGHTWSEGNDEWKKLGR